MRKFSATLRFGKMPRPSGIRHTPVARERVGMHPGDIASAEEHAAGVRRDRPARDTESCRLTRAVRSEQREHLTGLERQVDAVQHVDRPVSGPHRGELEDGRDLVVGINPDHLRARHDADFAVPRYARCTDGFAWMSAGVPCAITRPKSSTLIPSHVSITSGMSCSTSNTPSPR